MKHVRILLLVLALSALPAGSAAALEAMTPALGIIFIPSTIPVDAKGHELGGPEVLTYTLGSGLVFPFAGIFAFEPSLDVYNFFHLWSSEADRAIPTELSWRTTFTFGFLVGLPFSVTWRISPIFDLAFGMGPAFHLRAGILAAGVAERDPGDVGDVAKINDYFYRDERWLTPTTFLRGQYRLTDRVDFGFSARAFWPIYNLWNGSSWFWDEGVFGGALVVRYRFAPAGQP